MNQIGQYLLRHTHCCIAECVYAGGSHLQFAHMYIYTYTICVAEDDVSVLAVFLLDLSFPQRFKDSFDKRA